MGALGVFLSSRLCHWLENNQAQVHDHFWISSESVANSEFTQLDGRKGSTAKRLCDKRDRACSVVIFTKCQCFLVFYKKICLSKMRFVAKFLSRLSHKVCLLLSSPILLHKFTNIPKSLTWQFQLIQEEQLIIQRLWLPHQFDRFCG